MESALLQHRGLSDEVARLTAELAEYERECLLLRCALHRWVPHIMADDSPRNEQAGDDVMLLVCPVFADLPDAERGEQYGEQMRAELDMVRGLLRLASGPLQNGSLATGQIRAYLSALAAQKEPTP